MIMMMMGYKVVTSGAFSGVSFGTSFSHKVEVKAN